MIAAELARRLLGDEAYDAIVLAEARALVALGFGTVRAVDAEACDAVRRIVDSAPRQPEPSPVSEAAPDDDDPPGLRLVRPDGEMTRRELASEKRERHSDFTDRGTPLFEQRF